jgi:hypothetical protein
MIEAHEFFLIYRDIPYPVMIADLYAAFIRKA